MRTTLPNGALTLAAFALGAILAPASPARAASAVAFDSATGAYGYGGEYRSERDARIRAMNSCRRRGGRNCRIVASCGRGGYAWIYLYRGRGYRGTALGASCGWHSTGRANDAAKLACNRNLPRGFRCGVGPAWYDRVNDGHVPQRCKNQHPSRDPCYR